MQGDEERAMEPETERAREVETSGKEIIPNKSKILTRLETASCHINILADGMRRQPNICGLHSLLGFFKNGAFLLLGASRFRKRG